MHPGIIDIHIYSLDQKTCLHENSFYLSVPSEVTDNLFLLAITFLTPSDLVIATATTTRTH